jgi:hypothetical protein
MKGLRLFTTFTYVSRAVLTKIHCWRLIVFTVHSQMFVDAIHDLLNSPMFSLCTRHKQKLQLIRAAWAIGGVGELTAPHSRHVFYRKFDGAKELFMCWITLDGVGCVFGTDRARTTSTRQVEMCLNTGCQETVFNFPPTRDLFSFSRDLSRPINLLAFRSSPANFHNSLQKVISDDSSHQVFVIYLFLSICGTIFTAPTSFVATSVRFETLVSTEAHSNVWTKTRSDRRRGEAKREKM